MSDMPALPQTCWTKLYEGLAWRLAKRSAVVSRHWSAYRDGASLRQSGNPYLQAAATIPGWLKFAEAAALYRLAGAAPEGNFLEIGSFCGRSSVVLAGAMRERNSSAQLWCCDPFSGAGEPDQQSAQQRLMRRLGLARRQVLSTYDTFARNLARLGLQQRVLVFAAYSQDAIPVTTGEFALAFIDGWHDYPNTRRDALLVQGRILPGGFAAFHDYGPGCPGVIQAVDETLGADPRFERIACAAGSLALFRRRGAP